MITLDDILDYFIELGLTRNDVEVLAGKHPTLTIEDIYHVCYNVLARTPGERLRAAFAMRDAENLLNRIETNPHVMFGKPIIKGTRIPIDIILRKLADKISVTEILLDYPDLTEDDIRAAILYAVEMLAPTSGDI